MAITAKVEHCFQAHDGTSKDMYCNQFYFFIDGHDAGDVNLWGPALAATVHELWAEPLTAGHSISRYYNSRCMGNQGTTKIYDRTASGGVIPTGPPIYSVSDHALMDTEDYLPDANAGFTNLPEEVAVCLSYTALHTDGDLPRRRGRIYLGPLNTNALDASATGPKRLAPGLIDAMLNGAQIMQSNAALSGFQWRVFSTMDALAFDIVSFSVDNAFDTVRGRGAAPSARATVPVLP